MNDSERLRLQVTHGFAFRDLHPSVIEAIRAYRADGDPEHLNGTTYRTLRDGLVRRGHA